MIKTLDTVEVAQVSGGATTIPLGPVFSILDTAVLGTLAGTITNLITQVVTTTTSTVGTLVNTLKALFPVSVTAQ